MNVRVYYIDLGLEQLLPLSLLPPPPLSSRDNLATDGLYGLMIVAVSLIGFISVVWLQDQIRNGGGPQWLENDRREINRMQRREAENHLHNLQLHLDEVDRRSRIRRNAPERVSAAKEVAEAQDQRMNYIKRLQEIQSKRFDRKLEDLRLRQMELAYDLGVNQREYMILLRSARYKVHKNVQMWKSNQMSERLKAYRAEVGDENAFPPDWHEFLSHPTPPPANWDQGLSREELSIMEVSHCAVDGGSSHCKCTVHVFVCTCTYTCSCNGKQ